MLKSFCQWALYKKGNWTKNITVPLPQKAIICLAPHTSNWDFIMGLLYSRAEGFTANFLMKKEWFFWPLGPLFRWLGGIPVWRDKRHKMTDELAKTAASMEHFLLCVTPEGTRSRTTEWKLGFYFIALKAKLPILLYGLDYKTKCIQCTEMLIPSGNVEVDMLTIKNYYRGMTGKIPENFTIGDVHP